MQKIYETDFCKIYYSSSLQNIADETIKLLENKVLEYEKVFKINFKKQIIVNYFDTLEEFRNFIYEIRGEKESLPKYAKGTYDNGMINAYIEPLSQMNRLYTASHELFHILYMQYVLKNDYSKRVVWYDEGMAQFMSGEKDKLNDDEIFKEFYLKVKKETKLIPDLNKLTHGTSFYNEKYNGYALSYLSIRYLSQTLSEEEFYELMYDFSAIKKYDDNLVYKMFDYYDKTLDLLKKK